MSSDVITFDEQQKEQRNLPYGDPQGSFRGVTVWSNRDDGFFSGESNYVDYVVYTGFRYQCVEYARRFLLLTTGCTFASCGSASEIFDMNVIQNVETGKRYDFVAHRNGQTFHRPEPGDILVYPYHKEDFPWGHVGVISYVDDEKVGVAEQNHSFAAFISPSPDYLDGEPCVGRVIALRRNAEGHWHLHEPLSGADCLGWMSYPDAPRREVIHKVLQPLEELRSVRATPMDSAEHPRLWRYAVSPPSADADASLRALYVFRGGSGESLVAAATALARVVRFTLHFIFRCGRLSAAFTALPTNPLGAELSTAPATLDALTAAATAGLSERSGNVSFAHSARASEAEGAEGADAVLDAALSAYFGLSLAAASAVRRAFRRSEAHLLSSAAYRLVTADAHTARLPNGAEVTEVRARNPHDAAWAVEAVDCRTPRLIARLGPLRAARDDSRRRVLDAVVTGDASCFMASCECRVDFGRFVRSVEETRGPRSGLTIITNPNARADAELEGVFAEITAFCERFRYPVRVVEEATLSYTEAKLWATTPTGHKVHVDFCLCAAEWAEILAVEAVACGDDENGAITGCPALCRAALDTNSDVVFAKPIWTYLISGPIFATADAQTSLAPRFYDVCRRLYEYAAPKQPPELWAGDVHEFKDSCRRIHISDPVQQTLPDQTEETRQGVAEEEEGVEEDTLNRAQSLRVNAGIMNFAISCCTAQESNDEPVALMHLFMKPKPTAEEGK